VAKVEFTLTDQAGVGLTVDGYLFFITIKIRTMGIIKQAVPGGFSGKVGTVIGSSWKGIAVMRGPTIAESG
jgi:hypothetical protein